MDKKIVYVVGNHDIAFEKFVGLTCSNIESRSQYEFEYGNRSYRIQHGDQYETGLVHMRFTMNIISIFHDWLERYFKKNLDPDIGCINAQRVLSQTYLTFGITVVKDLSNL